MGVLAVAAMMLLLGGGKRSPQSRGSEQSPSIC